MILTFAIVFTGAVVDIRLSVYQTFRLAFRFVIANAAALLELEIHKIQALKSLLFIIYKFKLYVLLIFDFAFARTTTIQQVITRKFVAWATI